MDAKTQSLETLHAEMLACWNADPVERSPLVFAAKRLESLLADSAKNHLTAARLSAMIASLKQETNS